MAIIEVSHLKYRYPETKELALDDLNFSVEKGEFIGVIGANGAGKSTLSQAIMGLVPQFYKGAYGGRVLVDGLVAEETPLAQLCSKVGLVFQNPFNQLTGEQDTVYGEVAFGMQNLGIPREEMKKRLEKTLRLLDIWEYRERNPFELSGGQMQRVALASILVMEPDVILLDEPTSQLDPEGTEEVFRVVDTLAKSGITIVMIEQKIEKMAAYCDRILLMDQGKQVAFDTPGVVFSMPEIESYGVTLPAYTRLCRDLNRRLPEGTYPVTAEEAMQVFPEPTDLPQVFPSYDTEPGEENFRVENLDFHYLEQVPIFDRLQLRLDHRPAAIIGQNGAGKTTLVRLLKGLLKPVGGTIWYRGEDISQKTVAMLAGQIGYVFQNPDDQIFKYKVIDEVMFGPLNIGMNQEEAKQAAEHALELVDLSRDAQKNPYDLELYERKMVAIASVLAMNTQIVILDEPTIAQDGQGRKRIGRLIRKLAEEGRQTIAILHDMDFVAENFERVIVMAHGKILADGTAAEVFSRDEILQEARLQKPHLMGFYQLLEQKWKEN